MNSLYTFVGTIIITTLFVLGDSSATKYFSGENSWMWLVAGMILNALGVVLFGYLANRAGIADTSGIVLTLNIVGNIAIGALYFHDSLSGMQYVGIGFGVIGIIILSYY